jgi:hypothetical protein
VQVGQIIEEAPGVVFVVMRDAIVGGAYRGVRKTGVEGQWVLRRGCVVVGVVFVLVPPPCV